jgi:hypothetical protein
MTRAEATLARASAARRDLSQGAADLAERLGTVDATPALTLAELLAPTPQPQLPPLPNQ